MSNLSEEQRTQIRDLLAQGLSSEAVARRLGIPKMRAAAVKAHMTMGTYGGAAAPVPDLGPADLEEAAEAADLKFGLERDMQEAIRANVDQLDPGLRVADGGKERHVEPGFIDILAEDADGALVVIELKASDAPDAAITQILSYMGALHTERGRTTSPGYPHRARVLTACEVRRRCLRHPANELRLQLHVHRR